MLGRVVQCSEPFTKPVDFDREKGLRLTMFVNTEMALEKLGFESVDTLNLPELKKRYRIKAKQKHPDKAGGSPEEFVELQKAYQHLKKVLDQTEDELAKLRKAIIEENLEMEDAELERRLRIIEKSELLHKLIESERRVVVHKKILKKQTEYLIETRELVEELVVEYRDKQSSLRTELGSILDIMEKDYQPSVVQKIFFFLPKPDYNEFLDRKESLMNKFQNLSGDLENQLSREIVRMYGDALNQLTTTIEDIEHLYAT